MTLALRALALLFVLLLAPSPLQTGGNDVPVKDIMAAWQTCRELVDFPKNWRPLLRVYRYDEERWEVDPYGQPYRVFSLHDANPTLGAGGYPKWRPYIYLYVPLDQEALYWEALVHELLHDIWLRKWIDSGPNRPWSNIESESWVQQVMENYKP